MAEIPTSQDDHDDTGSENEDEDESYESSLYRDMVALLDAVQISDIQTVTTCIRDKCLSPDFIIDGRSPICTAAAQGREDILQVLLEKHCNLNAPDVTDYMWHRQPIHIAASKGYLGFVKALVVNGVDINTRDSDQRTALHWVATYGQEEVAEYLISVGASVDIAQVDGFTPLHAATCLGHANVCQVLLSKGADVNRTDRDGWNPLHTAVCYGHQNVVNTLLAAGASIQKRTNDEETVLHIAASSGHLGIVQLLIKHGALLEEKNINGYTAFHLAVYHNKYEIAKCLIKLHVDIHTSNNSDQTPFYIAAVRAQENFLRLLVSAGYDVSKETWLHEMNFPGALIKNSKLAQWIHGYATNPRSLLDLGCFRIQYILGKDCAEKVECLPLPTLLKDLLAYKQL